MPLSCSAEKKEFPPSFSKIKRGRLFGVTDVKIAAERIIMSKGGGGK
jgi:hypothetical protein